jgi:hypothetical protein
MNNGELIKQLEDAVNRAICASPEVDEIAREVRERGLREAKFEITIRPSVASVAWLENLHALSDPRREQ